MLVSSEFSRSLDDQVSINSPINIKNIHDFLNENAVAIQKEVLKISDTYADELFDYFFKENKLRFPVTKHIELFLLNNWGKIEKLVQYLTFRYKFYLVSSEKINLGFPPYLLLEPVSACNLRCPFCFQIDKSFTRKPYMGVMDFDLFKKVIDEADELGIGAVTLASRGEPTMHKKLSDMLYYMYSKSNIFEVKLNTNASFLTEDICNKIFKTQVTQVVVSADHYEKTSFEKLRLGANFEAIVENVDMLYRIRKNYPNSVTEIRVSGVDSTKTLDRKKFHDFWIERADHVSAGYAIERWDTYNNTEHPEISQACDFLWDRMYVWFDGKSNPCDADYKSYLSYGSVKDSSIKDVWNGKVVREMRQKHLSGGRKNVDPCNKCGVTFGE